MDSSHRTRAATFLLTLIAFGLGTCAEASSPRQAFLADVEARLEIGYSYEEITFLMLGRLLEGQTDPYASDGTKLEFDPIDPEAEDYDPAAARREVVQFATDLKNRNCGPIWAEIEASHKDPDRPLIRIEAHLYDQGICAAKDKAAAARLYKEILKRNDMNPMAHARLGALYWHGEGVRKNIARANALFRRAAVLQTLLIWIFDSANPDFRSQDSSAFKLWGKTNFYLMKGFGEFATGPWPAPKPLGLEIEGFLALDKDNPGRIVEIAWNLLEGRDGFEKDPDSAISWIRHAKDLEVVGAWYLEILWQMDPAICERRIPGFVLSDCEEEFSYWFGEMSKAAFEGLDEALRFMIDYHAERPNNEAAVWSLYQYCLLGERHGTRCDRDTYETVRFRLSSIEKKIIEAWVGAEMNFPITDFLPGRAD
jgi:hypothetical protein